MSKKSSILKSKGFYGVVAIVLAFTLYFLIKETNETAAKMAAIVILMAVFWIKEVIPIAVTSLFPIILFPLLGIDSVNNTTLFYGKSTIYLFLGGILLAFGLQKTGLHERISLFILNKVGSKPHKIILGMMIACGFLSMWISNTASVMVMLPIGLSIISEAAKTQSKDFISKFSVALMLGIAYAGNIGGVGTLIGTPPNLVFSSIYQDTFPNQPMIGFAQWMAFGVPLAIIFIFCSWLMLTKVIFKLPKEKLFEDSIIKEKIIALGKFRRDEKMAGLAFLLAAILWLTGSDINISNSFVIHGWRSTFNLKEVSDAAIAIGTAILLFMIPSKERKNEAILTWSVAKEIPWGILLLFGGGFALANGFKVSGLSNYVGMLFTHIHIHSEILLVLIICLILTFLTEITSNTAMTTLILPILAKAAIVLGINPLSLMIPATLSASCAFMMPTATPTNAIVFGSGYVSIKQMNSAGLWLNFIGVILVTFIYFTIGKTVLGIP